MVVCSDWTVSAMFSLWLRCSGNQTICTLAMTVYISFVLWGIYISIFPGSWHYHDAWDEEYFSSLSQAKPLLISPKFPGQGLSCWMIKGFLVLGGNEPSIFHFVGPNLYRLLHKNGWQTALAHTIPQPPPTSAPNRNWPIPLTQTCICPARPPFWTAGLGRLSAL